ncbi:PREDICTED: translation initiation factor IF-2-like [Calidris pugnax]|uniref:translation initiation factor IF-2-like n=1 Tax=Calidris pugnax TaxID=198806 RepID=UPI00071D16B4|nr:PREDICTED: translation initiation factor IF-2-like [Calidris pugnax]
MFLTCQRQSSTQLGIWQRSSPHTVKGGQIRRRPVRPGPSRISSAPRKGGKPKAAAPPGGGSIPRPPPSAGDPCSARPAPHANPAPATRFPEGKETPRGRQSPVLPAGEAPPPMAPHAAWRRRRLRPRYHRHRRYELRPGPETGSRSPNTPPRLTGGGRARPGTLTHSAASTARPPRSPPAARHDGNGGGYLSRKREAPSATWPSLPLGCFRKFLEQRAAVRPARKRSAPPAGGRRRCGGSRGELRARRGSGHTGGGRRPGRAAGPSPALVPLPAAVLLHPRGFTVSTGRQLGEEPPPCVSEGGRGGKE